MWELYCHRAKGTKHTWIETLNRLVRKGKGLMNARGDRFPPGTISLIKPEQLSARRESWDMDRLLAARHAESHKRTKPTCDSCPILVISISGKFFVLDGGTRLNRRIMDEDLGPHEVVVIERHE
jgi:hypothetical protein